ncbi:MAG: hypothetical protein ACLSGS_01690 [Adlercreutzia sp.]
MQTASAIAKVNGVEVADEDVFTVTYFDGAVETSRLTDAAVSDVKPVPAPAARPR